MIFAFLYSLILHYILHTIEENTKDIQNLINTSISLYQAVSLK